MRAQNVIGKSKILSPRIKRFGLEGVLALICAEALGHHSP